MRRVSRPIRHLIREDYSSQGKNKKKRHSKENPKENALR
jgi:hypothetical protein